MKICRLTLIALLVLTLHGLACSTLGTTTSTEENSSPTLSSLSTTTGHTSGGTSVTLTGTNLSGASSITFGNSEATSVAVVNSTTVTCTTPAHDAGSVDVTITTTSGTATLETSYTYATGPSLSSISPLNGVNTGGTSFTLTGSNLTGTTAVTFGGVAATSVTVVNDTTVTGITPAHANGSVDIVLTNAISNNTLTDGYSYLDLINTLKIIPLNDGTAIWRSSDHTLWGIGASERTGFGNDLTDAITDWTQVASDITKAWGFYLTLIVQNSDGDLLATGQNEWGQLANGETTEYNSPATTFTNVIVSGQSDSSVNEIYIGVYNSYCLVGDTNELYATGRNDSGQAGVNSEEDSITEYTDTGLDNIVSVTPGVTHVVALAEDGTVYGAGNNSYKQLSSAIGASTDIFEEMTIPETGGDVTKVVAGSGFTIILKEGGQLYGIGQNTNGALGGGSASYADWKSIATDVENVWAIYQSLLFITTDGTLYGQGDNWGGQLGLADIGSLTSINEIPFSTTPLQMYLGLFSSFMMDEEGNLFGAGENDSLKLGTASEENNVTEFTALTF